MRRRVMRTFRITAAFLGAVALVASACGGAQPATQTSPSGSASAAKQDIKIGVAISLTGAANVYGPSQQNGVNLALADINKDGIGGAKVQVLVEDDASTAQQSITVFKKFI